MPAGTKILDTNALVSDLETYIRDNIPAAEVDSVETIVGGGGLSLESLTGAESGVSENQAQMTVAIRSQDKLDAYAQQIRTQAETIFGSGNVTVSAASIISRGFRRFRAGALRPAGRTGRDGLRM